MYYYYKVIVLLIANFSFYTVFELYRDKCVPTCAVDTNNDRNKAPDTYRSDLPGAGKGIMYYYASSLLLNGRHNIGCGIEDRTNQCEIIIQYVRKILLLESLQQLAVVTMRMVVTHKNNAAGLNEEGISIGREGYEKYGQHESFEYYDTCRTRERIKVFSLRIIHQPLGNRQQSTPDKGTMGKGTGLSVQKKGIISKYCCSFRYGRLSNIFRSLNQPILASIALADIAVLTDDTSRCKYYQEESQNVVDKTFVSLKIMIVCQIFASAQLDLGISSPKVDMQWTWPPICLGNAMDGFYKWLASKLSFRLATYSSKGQSFSRERSHVFFTPHPCYYCITCS